MTTDNTKENGARAGAEEENENTLETDSTPEGYWPAIWRAKLEKNPRFRVKQSLPATEHGARVTRRAKS